jgi:hypothetical protein
MPKSGLSHKVTAFFNAITYSFCQVSVQQGWIQKFDLSLYDRL